MIKRKEFNSTYLCLAVGVASTFLFSGLGTQVGHESLNKSLVLCNIRITFIYESFYKHLWCFCVSPDILNLNYKWLYKTQKFNSLYITKFYIILRILVQASNKIVVLIIAYKLIKHFFIQDVRQSSCDSTEVPN